MVVVTVGRRSGGSDGEDGRKRQRDATKQESIVASRITLSCAVSIAMAALACGGDVELGPECGDARCQNNEACAVSACVPVSGHANVGGIGGDLSAKAHTATMPAGDYFDVTLADNTACFAVEDPDEPALGIIFPADAPLNEVKTAADGVAINLREGGAASFEAGEAVSVTLTLVDEAHVEGSFSAVFSTRGTIAGDFQADRCD